MKVRIFDTTLRDGEQTPGVSLTPSDKLEIARKLDELGVDVIEAGSAITSKGEREGIKLITKEGLNAEICSFVRALPIDIDAAVECDVDSVHLVVPTSPIHIKYKLRKTEDEVLETALKAVEYAKDHGLIVELSAEDATRSDVNFLIKLFNEGKKVGADRVCVCDTVGILTPQKSQELFKKISENVDLPVSVHCHNDFGMATANTCSAVLGGAVQCHVTINGVGERAGNASLEEVVSALTVLYNYKTNVKMEKLYEVSRLVSRLMKLPVPPNKAIVGDNAFAHEAGIHVDGLIKNTETYEPIKPEMVGNRRRIILGKHSGRKALKYKLDLMGIKVNEDQLNKIYEKIKEFGDLGKYISDADLLAIIREVLGKEIEEKIKLDELTVVSGNKITPIASVKLHYKGEDITLIETAYGVGPVDAAINAVRKAISGVADVKLEEYRVEAIGGGTDALIEVRVKLRKGMDIVEVKKADADIIRASVDAVMEGINLLLS
ncbi:isopropylmalate/citramalate/homocitrate synthase [Methanocaldococcus vulcanius M7]|uniref:Putative (R)-citramalate synthase CimA n=1 Tax=Methanocaldococcus vulcanius (strain ATCC 700851 / DSM 12094 / M7) TaxID=579137 RepID=C9RFN2_METVM|nr:2-isopropylmalate synthase [Methanocaldococcus vulcanius]ACX72384.1 isopropylmalate/citramalate/homocitrate synthase [Methanocaldococcus vulcanius M7]